MPASSLGLERQRVFMVCPTDKEANEMTDTTAKSASPARIYLPLIKHMGPLYAALRLTDNETEEWVMESDTQDEFDVRTIREQDVGQLEYRSYPDALKGYGKSVTYALELRATLGGNRKQAESQRLRIINFMKALKTRQLLDRKTTEWLEYLPIKAERSHEVIVRYVEPWPDRMNWLPYRNMQIHMVAARVLGSTSMFPAYWVNPEIIAAGREAGMVLQDRALRDVLASYA